MTIIMMLLGVALAILNSNNILIIDARILYLVFGVAGFSFMSEFINSLK